MAYSIDILRSYVLWFKSEYSGDQDVFVNNVGIPIDSSYINIYQGLQTISYAHIQEHTAYDEPIVVELNIFKNNNPYFEDARLLEEFVYSINRFSLYDYSVIPAINANQLVDIYEVSPRIINRNADWTRFIWIIHCLNVV